MEKEEEITIEFKIKLENLVREYKRKCIENKVDPRCLYRPLEDIDLRPFDKA